MTEQHILGPDDLGGSALAGGIPTPRADPRAIVHAIEDDERLDRVATLVDRPAIALGRSSAAPTLRGAWLGHPLHPALTDLPVGLWTSAFVLDLVGGRRARPAAQRLIGLGLLAVPVTAATGMADYETIDDQRARRVGAAHAAGNVAASLCYLASWRARRRAHHRRGVLWGLAGGSIASVTAHLGGHLAFGGSDDDARARDRDDRAPDRGQPWGRARRAWSLRVSGIQSGSEIGGLGSGVTPRAASSVAKPSGSDSHERPSPAVTSNSSTPSGPATYGPAAAP